MIDPATIPVVDFHEASTSRLISTAYIEEPALLPLVDEERELEALANLEMATSARHGTLLHRPRDVSAEELLNEAHGYGYTYINAAFCYTRPTGNRFSDEHRGAWYATFGRNAIETAKAEVQFHLTRELSATGVYDNTTDYQELVAGFSARFHDLGPFGEEDFLSPDIDVAYSAGQVLARALRQLPCDANGVIYPSQRRKRGRALACFRTNLIQNVRSGSKWRFSWNGDPTATVVQLS